MNLSSLNIIKNILPQHSQKHVSGWCQKKQLHCTISRCPIYPIFIYPIFAICNNGIFHYINLCHTFSILLYHLPKKKIFCIYSCFSVSRYIKGVRLIDRRWILGLASVSTALDMAVKSKTFAMVFLLSKRLLYEFFHSLD